VTTYYYRITFLLYSMLFLLGTHGLFLFLFYFIFIFPIILYIFYILFPSSSSLTQLTFPLISRRTIFCNATPTAYTFLFLLYSMLSSSTRGCLVQTLVFVFVFVFIFVFIFVFVFAFAFVFST
jgi:hypothetical protein